MPQLPPPDFNREVRPIIASHCLKCHGPDEAQRQAGLRLDISPGEAKLKKVLERIALPTSSPMVMPPANALKPLKDTERETIRRWIKAGAKYEKHWAFVKPVARVGSIDGFIGARLKKEGLNFSPAADRYTLIRRVSLDLVGLPPTAERAEAFVHDTRPDAYERLVDELQASPAYGERWARPWLDLARYADTNGYEKDRPRSIWPWRDWVVNALNADMPFDLFTVKQIAGDLLPNATQEDRVATGFHRNTMLNEEGGIDPLEYRYLSQVDRVATTGTTWLGLTMGCAQCHTHKYDPILHKDYFRFMAFIDNTEEPTIEVIDDAARKRRVAAEAEANRREAALEDAWPLPTTRRWTVLTPGSQATAKSGATLTVRPDSSVFVSGAVPDTDTYTVTLPGGSEPITALRLEALTDAALGGKGPGRTPHGNFVLTEIEVAADGKSVKLIRGEQDATQEGFSAQAALDGNPRTGWAIHIPDQVWNVDRTATFTFDKPVTAQSYQVTLRFDYGGQHTLGRFRLALGSDAKPETAPSRKDLLAAAFARWKAEQQTKSVRWQSVMPVKADGGVPKLLPQPDGSLFSAGDFTKRDVYTLSLDNLPAGVTAVRIDALPDPRLPGGGPGRVVYEGAPGDFFLSTVRIDGKAPKSATATIGNATTTLDDNPQTGWSINGAQGKPNAAVFVLEKPQAGKKLTVSLIFEQYYAAPLGHFKVSVTTDPKAGAAMPAAVETALAAGDEATLKREFLKVAPELASERMAIESLRRSVPAPTTLAFREWPTGLRRETFVHHRGEFLQTEERVTPGTPGFLPPAGGQSRLDFARWLVSDDNPLTARVTVNRAWASFFGRGIVKTLEDFGYQGAPPSHPELLDYLATTFMHDDHWSMKKLHRRIVLSQTYRQSSRTTPALLQKDPENVFLARGPRVRLPAETVRDSALLASGLLSSKRGGPPVFPPQPPGVTTEGAYGPLEWRVSTGEDRFRRSLYTFAKRTAPYALTSTFDAPSGEATCPRREMSNTPLQALALLNDEVFLDTARALGKQYAALPGTEDTRIAGLFQRILTRPPTGAERTVLTGFLAAQRGRLAKGELEAAALVGSPDNEAAAWMLTARTLLNLDEVVTKR
ncbi:MAG: PSD1 and planctomycete cytochrome C domain-containing protein [Armatimonas sp.]